MLQRLKDLQQVTETQNALLRLRLKEIKGIRMSDEEVVEMERLRDKCRQSDESSWECHVLEARVGPQVSFVPGVAGIVEEVEEIVQEPIEISAFDTSQVSEDFGVLQDKLNEIADERDRCTDQLKIQQESCGRQLIELRSQLDKGVDEVMQERIANLELKLFQQGQAPVWDQQNEPGAFEKAQNVIQDFSDKRAVLLQSNSQIFPQIAELESTGQNSEAKMLKQQMAKNEKQIDELNERIDMWEVRKKKTTGYQQLVAEWDATFDRNEGPINEAALALLRSYMKPVGAKELSALRGEEVGKKLNIFLEEFGAAGLKVLDLDNVKIPKKPKVEVPQPVRTAPAAKAPAIGMADLMGAIKKMKERKAKIEGGANPPPMPPPLPPGPLVPPPLPSTAPLPNPSTPDGRVALFQHFVTSSPNLVEAAETKIQRRFKRVTILKCLRQLPQWNHSLGDIRNALNGADSLDSVEARALSLVLPRTTPAGTPSKSDKDVLLAGVWAKMESKMPSMLQPEVDFVRDEAYLNAALPPVGQYPFEAVEAKVIRTIRTISRQDCQDYELLKNRPDHLERHVFSDGRTIDKLSEVLKENETIDDFCREKYGLPVVESNNDDGAASTHDVPSQHSIVDEGVVQKRIQPMGAFPKLRSAGRPRTKTHQAVKKKNPLLAAIEARASQVREKHEGQDLTGGFIQALNSLG